MFSCSFRSPSIRRRNRERSCIIATLELNVNELKRCRVVERGADPKTKNLKVEVKVPARAEQVWQVLTDYENLSNFIPNLVECQRLRSKRQDIVLLRQKACSQSLYWRLEAEVVLAVRERVLVNDAKELYFKLVDGDFEQFEGRWIVEDLGVGRTSLKYEVNIVTVANIPKSIVRQVIRAGLPANVLAVAKQAEKLAQTDISPPRLAEPAMIENSTPIKDQIITETLAINSDLQQELDVMEQFENQKENKVHSLSWMWNVGSDDRLVYMGVTSVPVPPLGVDQVDQYKNEEVRKKQSVERKQKLMKQQRSRSQAFSQDNLIPYVDEVHLRRLDTDQVLHRRVVVEVYIEASAQQVWDVITDYEALPQFVPNLAQSRILGVRRTNKPHKYLRLQQVIYKCMPYVCFHAECHLDVSEIPLSEIQFKQVQGDFEVFQGKWIIQEITPLSKDIKDGSTPLSTLQYAVEIAVPRSNKLFTHIEPLLDRFAMEDLSINLAAIKHQIEYNQKQELLKQKAEYFRSVRNYQQARKIQKQIGRPGKSDLEKDIRVLQEELKRCYGHTNGYMPLKGDLIKDGRFDLANAIQKFGGPQVVAEQLGWKMKYLRRPRGYWLKTQNLRIEMKDFLQEHQLPKKTMPSRVTFLSNGRKDLVRAIETHYGGFMEVALLLGWEFSKGSKIRVSSERFQAMKKMVLDPRELDIAFGKNDDQRSQLLEQYSEEQEETILQQIVEEYERQQLEGYDNEDDEYQSKSYSDVEQEEEEEDELQLTDIIVGDVRGLT